MDKQYYYNPLKNLDIDELNYIYKNSPVNSELWGNASAMLVMQQQKLEAYRQNQNK